MTLENVITFNVVKKKPTTDESVKRENTLKVFFGEWCYLFDVFFFQHLIQLGFPSINSWASTWKNGEEVQRGNRKIPESVSLVHSIKPIIKDRGIIKKKQKKNSPCQKKM